MQDEKISAKLYAGNMGLMGVFIALGQTTESASLTIGKRTTISVQNRIVGQVEAIDLSVKRITVKTDADGLFIVTLDEMRRSSLES